MSVNIEEIILSNLLYDEEFSKKTLTFLEREWFKERNEQVIFGLIKEYTEKYNTCPKKEALLIDLEELSLNQDEHENAIDLIKSLDQKEVDLDWLIDNTEQWAKDRAIHNAILESISIIDKNVKSKKSEGDIPEILSDALSVGFDNHVGHDYLEDFEKRFDFYHKKEEKIPFSINILNKITNGGVSRKTINVFMGGTGTGKTLVKCHLASDYLRMGKNVLYITLEMAEEEIAKRIDSNCLNIKMDDIGSVTKNMFIQSLDELKNQKLGNLIIKEYPTASAHVGHFRFLLKELKMKKKFVPDVLIIDYLNICASSRIKSRDGSSYLYVKTVTEEIRGLSQEFNIPIITSTQLNREGYVNSDPGMENTSECVSLDTLVKMDDGSSKEIQNIKIGDRILGKDGFVEVTNVFDKKVKMSYKITTKSGKTLILSKDHEVFTKEGLKNIKNGLKVGDKLFIKN